MPIEEEEVRNQGFSWTAQLIALAMLIVAGGLVFPGGGGLALVDSAGEGMIALAKDRGEVVALGLAEANAGRMIRGEAPVVDPFDNVSGVKEAYVLDANRKVLVPASEKGTLLSTKNEYLERPIRAEGKTLGYAVVEYDVGKVAKEGWSPITHALGALVVGLVELLLLLPVGYWLILRPWLRLAESLEKPGKIAAPAAFRAMERVVKALNRSRR